MSLTSKQRQSNYHHRLWGENRKAPLLGIRHWLFLIYVQQHICSKRGDQKKAAFKETQSEMFRLAWQRTCANRGFLPPRRRQAGRHSANQTRRPCFVEITIIVSHVWKYYVCEELLPVSPVISWLAKKKNRGKCWSEPAEKTQKKERLRLSGRFIFKTTSERLPSETHIEELHTLCFGKIFSPAASKQHTFRRSYSSSNSPQFKWIYNNPRKTFND